MKTFILLALLALVASTAFAKYAEAPSGDAESPSQGGSPEQCEQEHTKLNSCRDYLMERCRPTKMPITWPWEWMKSRCKDVLNRCCQQLGQVASQCRCKTISRTIQGDLGGFSGSQEGQEARVVLMAKNLPSKCNMGPRSCEIPITSAYYM